MPLSQNWPMGADAGPNIFGNWLVARRTALGMSCNQLALTSDIHQANLNKVERGLRQVTDDMLTKLAPVLGMPLEELKRIALRDRLSAADQHAAAMAYIEGLKALPPDQRAPALDELRRYVRELEAGG